MATLVKSRPPRPPIAKRALARDVDVARQVLATKGPPDVPEPSPAPRSAARSITDVPVDRIHRHPANRAVTPVDCQDLAECIRAEGRVLVPVRLRRPPDHWKLPPGHFQLVAGERRWWAVQTLGWPTIPAEIDEHLDDAATLRILHEDNAQRRDLNDLERARGLQDLHAPSAAGGAGLTWEEAGRVYSLTAGAAINLVKILEAPEAWRRRFLSPENDSRGRPMVLHQATLREIAKFRDVPAIQKALEDWYRRTGKWHWPGSRDGQVEQVQQFAERETRSIDPKKRVHYGYQVGEHPCYLDVADAALRQRLQVVELPLGKDGAMVPRATNVKLFDQLQVAEIERRQKAKKSGKDPDTGGKAKPPTAAELKARAAKQADQLQRFAREWRYRFLRLGISRVMTVGDWRTAPTCLFLLAQDFEDRRAFLAEVCDGARDDGPELLSALLKRLEGDGDPVASVARLQLDLARWYLWPQADAGDKRPEFTVLAEDLPERLPRIGDEDVDRLAQFYAVTVAAEWRAAAGDKASSPRRAMIRELLDRHTSEQLDHLAAELRITASIAHHAKKGDRVVVILELHTGRKGLTLPKLLEAGGTRRARR